MKTYRIWRDDLIVHETADEGIAEEVLAEQRQEHGDDRVTMEVFDEDADEEARAQARGGF